MYSEMKETGVTEVSVKSILEIGVSNRGKRCLFLVLKNTGLIHII